MCHNIPCETASVSSVQGSSGTGLENVRMQKMKKKKKKKKKKKEVEHGSGNSVEYWHNAVLTYYPN